MTYINIDSFIISTSMFNVYHVPDTLLGVIYTIVDKLDKAPGTFILVHLN